MSRFLATEDFLSRLTIGGIYKILSEEKGVGLIQLKRYSFQVLSYYPLVMLSPAAYRPVGGSSPLMYYDSHIFFHLHEHVETLSISKITGERCQLEEVPRTDLPLYIGYPCTSFFDKLLRGQET